MKACTRSTDPASEPLQSHTGCTWYTPLKSNLVHLTRKATTFSPARGDEPPLRPWQLVILATGGTETPLALGTAVDQVHFEGLYQVHRHRLRTPSEPHWVYLIHPLKSDLVHLIRKATTFSPAGGDEPPLRPR